MKIRTRVTVNLACGLLMLFMLIPTGVVAQRRVAPDGARSMQRGQHEEDYRESSLRRFEIVSLISLPFTTIHSFLVVRGVEMVRQKEIAPELSNQNYTVIGASAVSFALFIGFWDWLHTRDKDSSEQLMPSTPSPRKPRREVEKPRWNAEDESCFAFPIVQVRF
ncbi:MAG: hypothetical protein OXN17_13860 [Candidatus Poribacteria bacterium]|nr:hypothetical protein [Candidatus Poribacteria bacterium]